MPWQNQTGIWEAECRSAHEGNERRGSERVSRVNTAKVKRRLGIERAIRGKCGGVGGVVAEMTRLVRIGPRRITLRASLYKLYQVGSRYAIYSGEAYLDATRRLYFDSNGLDALYASHQAMESGVGVVSWVALRVVYRQFGAYMQIDIHGQFACLLYDLQGSQSFHGS